VGAGTQRRAGFLRRNATSLGAAVVLLSLLVLAVRWIASNRQGTSPRKVVQFTFVSLPPPPPRAPPPPPPPVPQKVEEPEVNRVNLKPQDLLPPDEPRQGAPSPAGPLALAEEGQGPGDGFNLAGNPGGRGLLGSGDGSADVGGGGGNPFGWYYAELASEIEDAFRKQRQLSTASARVDLRVWVDAGGRITRIQLLRSTGDPQLDEAIQSVVGLRLRERPPRDIPMPMIARLTARRPQ